MKSKMFLLCAIVGLTALWPLQGSYGVVALNQNFEGFTLGSLNVAGQGGISNVGGIWTSTQDGGDPCLVTLAALSNPANKALQFAYNQGNALGKSSVAPIATGTPFILKFSEFFRGIGDVNQQQLGSCYLYCDNADYLNPSSHAIGIATNSAGTLYLWDGYSGGWRRITDPNFFAATSRDKWVDFKIVLTTWDDGNGYAKFDTYFDAGNGWQLINSGNRIDVMLGEFHSGVNGVLIVPYGYADGILNSYDNVVITSTPLDCHDNMVLGVATLPQDFNMDCIVNFEDFVIFTSEWLMGSDY